MSLAFALAVMASGAVSIAVIAQDKRQEASSFGWLTPVGIGGPTEVIYGIVKDAPFSGEMVFEHIQTLNDGNRTGNRSSAVIHRDSRGRTRNEYSLNLLNGKNFERRTIIISDPVAGNSYTLDPQTRTAYKHTFPVPANTLGQPRRSGDAVSSIQFAKGMKLKTVILHLGTQLGLDFIYDDSIKDAQLIDAVELKNVTIAKALAIILKTNKCSFEQEGRAIRIRPEDPAKSGSSVSFESFYANLAPSLKSSLQPSLPQSSESLGKQTIDGVEAEGTRITHVIPAGAIGNDRPIEIVTERWYSQELQMAVMTKWIDPRSGESTQRLTNLIRGEPDAALFQIPSDYTIREIENVYKK
jgi:Secretin and TonB N terminus short domain